MKLFQESSNLVINTAEGKGDMLVNGRSLKGLFATVADLEDDVNAMTTVGASLGAPLSSRVLAGPAAPARPPLGAWVGRKRNQPPLRV